MKAIGLTEFGGPEVLKVIDLPEPEPGPGEVRIRVHAVAPFWRRFERAAMLFGATQEQMIGAALAGLSWSQASRMSGGLGIGQRDALIRPAVIRTIGVWPLLPWRAGQLARATTDLVSTRRHTSLD